MIEDPYIEQFRRKTLHQLETQYRGLTSKGIPDAEREIGLLEAQIAGLLDHRPDGFGPRIELLREKKSKLEQSLEGSRRIIAALEVVIREKEAEL